MKRATTRFTKIKQSVSIFAAPNIPLEVAGRIRAKQLDTVSGLVPAIMMAQLINGWQ